MTAIARPRMTADQFIEWAMSRPDGERYELVAGELVGMVPERAAHARAKANMLQALTSALSASGLPCEAFPDGMAVQVDDTTVCEPDALVRCGNRLADDAVKITDPVIVVEVLSPSTRARDAGAKLDDYFRLASIRHYLIVKTENHTVIHHRRADDGQILTGIVRDGEVRLDPPGIAVALSSLFPE